MNDTPLYSITIPQLAEHIPSSIALNDNFIISTDIKSCVNLLRFPLRIEAFLIGIRLKGAMTISVNMTEWTASESKCIFSLPENIIGVEEVSDDFEGMVIAISMDYLQNMNIDLKSILHYYAFIRIYPSIDVPNSEMVKIEQICKLIIDVLSDDECGRQEDIVRSLFSALVFKCCDQLDRQGFNARAIRTKSKEYYFMRFMELLLSDFRICRKVVYYSDRLGLTPKYLSSLIRSISGFSAAEWIDQYTIAEASVLLRFSNKTIQQIADDLNFPSQSFFSKYYKQHSGKSPSEYRNTAEI